jgi:hypothetical protein
MVGETKLLVARLLRASVLGLVHSVTPVACKYDSKKGLATPLTASPCLSARWVSCYGFTARS